MTAVRRLEIRVDQTGNAAPGIKGIAGSVGKIAGIGLAAGAAAIGGVALLTGAVLKLGSRLSGLGGDAEEMQSKFDTVFGKSAPDAARELDEFGNVVGRNKFALMEMGSTVQDTFVPLGFARDKAADLSVDLVKLAVDVGSFNNQLAPQVMEDFQSAIIGNHETVRKYGIIITQATLDQELLNMGVEGGVKEATEMEKVQARLNMIYAGTSDAQGDAAKTAGSWTNMMLGMKQAVKEGATEMGLFLNDALLPLLSQFVPWIKDLMPKAVEVFKEFAGNLKETIGPAMLMIQDAVQRIAEAFGVQTSEVSAADVVMLAFEKTLGLIVTVVQLVGLAFQAAAWYVETWKKGINLAKHALGGMRATFNAIIGSLSSVRRALSSVIGYWDRLKRAARRAVDAIPSWLRPGSPTPFEVGLRGIADAAKDINLNMGVSALGAPMAAGGRGGGVQLHLTYAPVISTADIIDIETKLVPFLISALRKAGVDVGKI